MSSNGINLLHKKDAGKASSLVVRLRILRLGAIAVLFFSGLASIVISILIVFSPLPALQANEEQARSDLSIYTLDINKLAFVNERGDNIRKILKSRSVYDKKLNIVQDMLPAGVSFDGLTIIKKNYTFKFSSTDLGSLDELLKALTGISGKGKEFVTISLTSLSSDEINNRFILVVDLTTV